MDVYTDVSHVIPPHFRATGVLFRVQGRKSVRYTVHSCGLWGRRGTGSDITESCTSAVAVWYSCFTVGYKAANLGNSCDSHLHAQLKQYNGIEVDVDVLQYKWGGRQFNWPEWWPCGFSISYSLKINPKSSVLMQGPQSAVLAVKKSFLKTDVCCGLLHTGNGKTWQWRLLA